MVEKSEALVPRGLPYFSLLDKQNLPCRSFSRGGRKVDASRLVGSIRVSVSVRVPPKDARLGGKQTDLASIVSIGLGLERATSHLHEYGR